MKSALVMMSHPMLEALLRLDAATFVLMTLVGLYVLREFLLVWLEDGCDRSVQLMLAFAALALWIALEVFALGMTRATVLAGIDSAWFLNSNWRLVVPASGVLIGLCAVWWISRRRWWVIGLGFGATVLVLAWPEPVRWLMLTAYRLMDG